MCTWKFFGGEHCLNLRVNMWEVLLPSHKSSRMWTMSSVCPGFPHAPSSCVADVYWLLMQRVNELSPWAEARQSLLREQKKLCFPGAWWDSSKSLLMGDVFSSRNMSSSEVQVSFWCFRLKSSHRMTRCRHLKDSCLSPRGGRFPNSSVLGNAILVQMNHILKAATVCVLRLWKHLASW